MTESFQLAKNRRLYLVSFLGLLYLPIFFIGYLWMWKNMVVTDPAPDPAATVVPFLVWTVLVAAFTLPSVIAPVVLYFQFKAKADQIAPHDLARLVDDIHDRHT